MKGLSAKVKFLETLLSKSFCICLAYRKKSLISLFYLRNVIIPKRR